MAKGAIAKENIISKLQEAFGPDDFIGVYDKKVYLWADDGGSKVQIALSMTCPKNMVGVDVVTSDGGIDFTAPIETQITPTAFEPAEITDEEKQNIADLLAKLNL